MDIAKAFSFVFEDERWITKVLIGGLLLFIPIVNFAAIGYMLQVAQNVSRGMARPLPEWSEFGEHFMRGLYGVVIMLVYFIPAGVLYALFFCVIAAASGSATNEESSGAAGAVGLVGVCLLPLIFLLFFVGYMAAYAGMARYMATNTLSEAFKFGEVIAMLRNNLSTWLMLLLVIFLAGFVGSLGMIACGVGVLFTSFYSQLTIGHTLGQIMARQWPTAGGYTQTPPSDYGSPPAYS